MKGKYLQSTRKTVLVSRSTRQEFLYLTTKGWKTGAPHRIEIWYVQHQGRFYLVSQYGRASHWVQNIQHNPGVAFQVGGTSFHGLGRVVDVGSEPGLVATVSRLMLAKYKWSEGLIVELRPEPGSDE